MALPKEFGQRLEELRQQEEGEGFAKQERLEEEKRALDLKSKKWEEEKPIRFQRLLELIPPLREVLEEVNEIYLKGRGEIKEQIDQEEVQILFLNLDWDWNKNRNSGNRISLLRSFNFHAGLKESMYLGLGLTWQHTMIDPTEADWLEKAQNGIIEALEKKEYHYEYSSGLRNRIWPKLS